MDEKRVLSMLDTLDRYLDQLSMIKPSSSEGYDKNLEKKMACERLLHLLIETTIDTCYLLVKELKLGLPAGDESAIDKLSDFFSPLLVEKLRGMKRLRNILVHRYKEIVDERVFSVLENNLGDFQVFKGEVIGLLESQGEKDGDEQNA